MQAVIFDIVAGRRAARIAGRQGNVLVMPLKVAASAQSVALGAAIFGSVAAGYYKDIYQAQENMASSFIKTYKPIEDNVKTYQRLYDLNIEFGTQPEDFLRKL